MKKHLLLCLTALALALAGCGSSSGYYDDPYVYDPGYPYPATPTGPTWTLMAYYDTYEMPAGTILDVDDYDGVLNNDTYRIGETYLEFPSRTQQGGYVIWDSDGSFEYEPPSDTFSGRDQFSYTLSDDYGRTSSAIVYIDVY